MPGGCSTRPSRTPRTQVSVQRTHANLGHRAQGVQRTHANLGHRAKRRFPISMWQLGGGCRPLRDSGGLVQLTRHLRAGLSHSVPAALAQRSMMELGDSSKAVRQASTWTARRGLAGCLLSPRTFRRCGVTPKSARRLKPLLSCDFLARLEAVRFHGIPPRSFEMKGLAGPMRGSTRR
jgi:hypothetical protein